jgi:hypothetical protein
VDGLQIQKAFRYQNDLKAHITKNAVASHWTFARSFRGDGSVAIIGPTVVLHGPQRLAEVLREREKPAPVDEKNAVFVLSKEKGSLGYFWARQLQIARSGKELGGVV